LAAGDWVELVGASTPDSTLANFGMNIKGSAQ
jgi:hypothetical protein